MSVPHSAMSTSAVRGVHPADGADQLDEVGVVGDGVTYEGVAGGDARVECVDVCQQLRNEAAWWSSKRPSSASRSAGISARSGPMASSASTAGSR